MDRAALLGAAKTQPIALLSRQAVAAIFALFRQLVLHGFGGFFLESDGQ